MAMVAGRRFTVILSPGVKLNYIYEIDIFIVKRSFNILSSVNQGCSPY